MLVRKEKRSIVGVLIAIVAILFAAAPADPAPPPAADSAAPHIGDAAVKLGIGGRQYRVPIAAVPQLGHGLGLSRFALDTPRSTGAQQAQPQYAMHTLTLRGIDRTGRPSDGDLVVVMNLDDSSRLPVSDGVQSFGHGVAKYSVPAGHYVAISYFFSTTPDGLVTELRVVTNPEFTVSGDRSVRLDARSATSRVEMVTPRPATPDVSGFVVQRNPAQGDPLYLDFSTTAAFGAPVAPVYVAPTAHPVQIGALHSYPWQLLAGPHGDYVYYLQFDAARRIPTQRYEVRPGALATVRANYYDDISTRGATEQAGYFPWELRWHSDTVRMWSRLQPPRRRTEYFAGDPRILWSGTFMKYTVDTPLFVWYFGNQIGSATRYRAGQRLSTDWNGFPLHPTADVDLLAGQPGAQRFQPPVTRDGDVLDLQVRLFGDNTPGHTGMGLYGDQETTTNGHYSLVEDGRRVAGGALPADDPEAFYTRNRLSSSGSTARLVLDAHRSGPSFPLSTNTHTAWTWRTAHRGDADLRYRNWRCSDGTTHCTVEPLLTLRYNSPLLDIDGTQRPGLTALHLTVGHLQGAAASMVTGAVVQVSTDDGTTWTDATVHGHRGRFVATYRNPDRGDVTLRVRATDAAGGSITETVRRAYAIDPEETR